MTTLGWHNTRSPFDVDASGKIDAADVLAIINYINAHASDPSLPPPPAAPPPFYDVDDDGLCLPSDVLLVINYINTHAIPGGEGEGGLRAATASDGELAAVAPREPVQVASVRVQPVPAHFVAFGNARESSFGSAFFVDVWNVRDFSCPAGAMLPAWPSTPVFAQEAGDQPSPVSKMDIAPLAVNRRGLTSDAVFAAWPDAPWDELTDTLARELNRLAL